MVAAAYDVNNWARGMVVSRACESREAWMDLDRRLRSVAARRSALDHEELTLLREAVREQLWRFLGMTSMREYLEQAMGYGPQVAAERLRVADALDALPALEDALLTNELTYSAVREVTRIATCKTEDGWLEACRGKTLRQIEELVAEREPGDLPTDRPKPDLRPRKTTMMLRPAARALMQQVLHALANERGERIDTSELMEELCRSWLAGRAPCEDGANGGASEEDGACDAGEDAVRPRTARPPVQIAITKCDSCGQARQHAAGRMIAITEAEYETAACDAVLIGSLDGAPARASSTIPPRTRRFVKQRDRYKCTVPWCRAAANIDVHHIVHREHGGGHEPENLTSLCWGHHSAHHRGELLIEGTAPRLTFQRRFDGLGGPHVGDLADRGVQDAPASDHIGDALLALTTLGFTKPEAWRAVATAQTHISAHDGLEALLRAALRELR